MVVKKAKLVTISEYARFYKIDRATVYLLLKKGKLTRYESPEEKPLLSLSERLKGIKRYKGYRERRTK